MPPVSNPDHQEPVNCIYVPTFHPGFQHWASKEQILSCLTRNSVSPQAIGYWWQFHLIIRLSGCLFLVIQLHKSTSPVFTPPENLTQHSAKHPNLYAKISNLDFTNKMHILHQLNFLCPLDAPKTMLSMEAHRDLALCFLCMVKLCQHLHLDPWMMWYEYEIWAPAQDKAFRFSIKQSWQCFQKFNYRTRGSYIWENDHTSGETATQIKFIIKDYVSVWKEVRWALRSIFCYPDHLI